MPTSKYLKIKINSSVLLLKVKATVRFKFKFNCSDGESLCYKLIWITFNSYSSALLTLIWNLSCWMKFCSSWEEKLEGEPGEPLPANHFQSFPTKIQGNDVLLRN